jgi:hypothetical protein
VTLFGSDSRSRSVAAVSAVIVVMSLALTVVGVSVAKAGPTGVPGSWNLVFDEEFNSAGLNTKVWTPGWQHGGVSGPMNGTCVSSANAIQNGNGYLRLELTKATGECTGEGSHASTALGGLVESSPADGVPGHTGFSYLYGDVEWRVSIPGIGAPGCPKGGCLPDFPALWSLPVSHVSEIDTMEGLNKLGQACFHLPPPFGEGAPGACVAGSYAGFHTYDADWEPNGTVTFYYDGTKVGQISSTHNTEPQYLVMDLVNSIDGQPVQVPDTMSVDYVRVWQHPEPGAWTEWESLGGETSASPTLSSMAENNLDIFVPGTDKHVYHKWYSASTGWSGYEGVPGVSSTSDGPSSTSWSKGRLDLFVRGTDNALWHTFYSEPSWEGGWDSLGGGLTSAPASSTRGAGKLDVFAKGTDNALWHIFYVSGIGWSGWESLGGELAGAPASVSWSSGRVDVFAAGASNTLYHRFYEEATGWSAWESLSGYVETGTAPCVSSLYPGELDLFIIGAEKHLYHRTYRPGVGWSEWQNLGGTISGRPGCASWSPSRIDIVDQGAAERGPVFHKNTG